jgi:hypothetical protein
VHDCPLSYWPIYPGSLRKLFIRAFTAGLHDPDARVMENEWRKEMCALRDAIFLCPHCDAENFFDLELLRQTKSLNPCWGCQSVLGTPPRMRMGAAYGSHLVMLSPGAQLFAHHLEGDAYNFGSPLAEVVAGPLGLRNLSSGTWTCRSQSGSTQQVRINEVLALGSDCQINFGKSEAEVRVK